MAAKLARRLRAYYRAHLGVRIHIFAYSGGAAIAVFACEGLKRRMIENLFLAAPALSPGYNLAPALAATSRCIALISDRDRIILDRGTRLFGTVDRQRTVAAGAVGFDIPSGLSEEERHLYGRLEQIRWKPEFLKLGVSGGHSSWLSIPFLQEYIVKRIQSR